MKSEITLRDLYLKILELNITDKYYKFEAIYNFILCKFNNVKDKLSDYQRNLRNIFIFFSEFDKRWQKYCRKRNRIDDIFKMSLNTNILLSEVPIILHKPYIVRSKVLFNDTCKK